MISRTLDFYKGFSIGFFGGAARLLSSGQSKCSKNKSVQPIMGLEVFWDIIVATGSGPGLGPGGKTAKNYGKNWKKQKNCRKN